LLLYPHQINWGNNAPVPEKGDPERVDILQDGPLKLECKHFIKCIDTGKTPMTDGAEGLRVLKILNTAQSSLDASVKSPVYSTQTSEFKSPLIGKENFFTHKTVEIDENVKIGDHTKFWHFSHILSG